MIKTFSRFLLLLLVCLLLVYAPEIMTSVSAPYSVSAPRRALLRIALCCEDEQTVSSIYSLISAYQKEHAFVHLRLTQISPEQLSLMQAPYPDVFLLPRSLTAQLPTDASLHDTALMTCAVSAASPERETAAGFAAYLYEAIPAQTLPSDF